MADMVDDAWLDSIDFNQESDFVDWTALASQADFNTWDNSEASDAWTFQSVRHTVIDASQTRRIC